MRSLQRGLHKDDAGRRITDSSAGPLFGEHFADGDEASGTIYVLRSKSDLPLVQEHRSVLHKIGVHFSDMAVISYFYLRALEARLLPVASLGTGFINLWFR